jgi:hypothetical protein
VGTWGAGSFDNDAVLDWLAELDGGGVKAVRDALDVAADADPDEYLEVDDAQAALGAAEIVAAACGAGDDRIAELEEVVAWLASHRAELRDADRAAAQRAVQRVLDASELQELWDEGDPDNEWRAVVAELLRRLSGTPARNAGKGPAPKKAAPEKAVPGTAAPAKAASKKAAPPKAASKKVAPKKTAPKK